MPRMILLQYSRPLNDRKGIYFLSWTPSCSSFGKIRMRLFTGLLRVVACVFTTADLTRPWPSGCTSKTRANDQKLGGTFSSRISTISPSTRFLWGFAICFFLALLLDIPSSIGTKINLPNAALFATGDAYTHHFAETFLVVAISQWTWLSRCG